MSVQIHNRICSGANGLTSWICGPRYHSIKTCLWSNTKFVWPFSLERICKLVIWRVYVLDSCSFKCDSGLLVITITSHGRHCVLNIQQPDWSFNRLFWLTTKKTSNFRITGPLLGEPQVTDGFPSWRASNVGSVSMLWCFYDAIDNHTM